MKLSVKGEYALQALFDLATKAQGVPIKISQIAKDQEIPQKFLELILAELKKAGFVESRRGAEGGYLLARSPASIRVGEVLRVFEGPAQGKGRDRGKSDNPFSSMWQNVDRAVGEIIDHTTFADLIRDWREKQTKFVPNWQI